MNIFKELKRRKAFKAAGLYAVVAWVLIQIGETTFDSLGLPGWALTLLIVLIIAGFPIAMIFAWIFDRTPTGLVRTESATDDESGDIEGDANEEQLLEEMAGDSQPDESTKDPNSIAVLPFTSLNKSEDAEVISDGITENLLTHLAKIGNLKVVSRTSVMQYKNTTKTIKEIGNELSVTSILEGSVQKSGDRIRITGQLINAENDEHLWAESYDRDYIDIFDIQSDVARKIAHALHTTLSPEEIEELEEKPTSNMEAYDFYLKGLYFWHTTVSKEGNQRAVDMFAKAIDLDHGFALAYARSCIVSGALYFHINWDRTPERLELVEHMLEKAMELAPHHPLVVHAQATVSQIKDDYKGTVELYKKAIEADPKNSEAVEFLGRLHWALGDWEKAEQRFIQARKIDPHEFSHGNILSAFYAFHRRFGEAEAVIKKVQIRYPEEQHVYLMLVKIALAGHGDLEKAKEILAKANDFISKPGSALLEANYLYSLFNKEMGQALEYARQCKATQESFWLYGYTLELVGRTDEAKQEFESMKNYYLNLLKKNSEDAILQSKLGLCYAGMGETELAIEHGQKGVKLQPVTLNHIKGTDRIHDLAQIYIYCGDKQEAIEQLEQLFKGPNRETHWTLRLNPIYDSLRDEKRFQDLLVDISKTAATF
ncbi:MAG: tetratricopeptide repeat protein [Candidatus Marinimicrobia bacterium]|nr:tetratricopeptide repeat protein [Candidatus Neomarinimicrobiota bacterium]